MSPPSDPLPSWVDEDFDCGSEPAGPAQITTKGAVETYVAGTLGWGRTCSTKLKARGADAKRYNLVRKKKK